LIRARDQETRILPRPATINPTRNKKLISLMKNKNPRRSSNIGKLAISTAGEKKTRAANF